MINTWLAAYRPSWADPTVHLSRAEQRQLAAWLVRRGEQSVTSNRVDTLVSRIDVSLDFVNLPAPYIPTIDPAVGTGISLALNWRKQRHELVIACEQSPVRGSRTAAS